MILMDILAGVVGGYIIYKLEKIDKRQDVIEVDIAIIKSGIPKRHGDDR